MTATLSGDNPPTATILYPHDVTTSLDILHVNDDKANTYAESRDACISAINIEISMTAILSGDNPPIAAILYPHDVTTSRDILQVSDGKAKSFAKSRVVMY